MRFVPARTDVTYHFRRDTTPSPRGALASDLLASFDGALQAAGPELTRDTIRALGPAVVAVRRVHMRVAEECDAEMREGYIEFDEACQAVERASLREEEALRRAIVERRVRIHMYDADLISVVFFFFLGRWSRHRA
jgi:hypothetical protein